MFHVKNKSRKKKMEERRSVSNSNVGLKEHTADSTELARHHSKRRTVRVNAQCELDVVRKKPTYNTQDDMT